jgi:hypothetical protein
MDSSDILVLSDTEEELSRLTRLKPIQTKEEKVLEQYGFMKSDEETPYTYTSEESYTDDLADELREKLGLENRDVALYDALRELKYRGWKEFLNNPFVQRFLGPAYYIISTCGEIKDTKSLWENEWAGELEIGRVRGRNVECTVCSLDRFATYVAYRNTYDEDGNPVKIKIGYIGRFCYYKFRTLINLINEIKRVANRVDYYDPVSDLFKLDVVRPIQEALDKVGAASKITEAAFINRRKSAVETLIL